MFTFLSRLVYSCRFELNENKEIYFIKLNGLLRDLLKYIFSTFRFIYRNTNFNFWHYNFLSCLLFESICYKSSGHVYNFKMIHHISSPPNTAILRSNTFSKKRGFRMQSFQQLLVISYFNFLNESIYSEHLRLIRCNSFYYYRQNVIVDYHNK